TQRASDGLDFYRVADLQVLQAAKIAVAVAREADVAVDSGHRRALDPADAAVQLELARADENRDRELQRGDLEHAGRGVERFGERLAVTRLALRRPNALIRRARERGSLQLAERIQRRGGCDGAIRLREHEQRRTERAQTEGQLGGDT